MEIHNGVKYHSVFRELQEFPSYGNREYKPEGIGRKADENRS